MQEDVEHREELEREKEALLARLSDIERSQEELQAATQQVTEPP